MDIYLYGQELETLVMLMTSKFVDDETALKQFKKHLGQEELEFKNIKMRVGIHNRLWVKKYCCQIRFICWENYRSKKVMV